MIRDDPQLLAELARLNTGTTALAIRIMDDTASTTEQREYAQRLFAAGQHLRRRANKATRIITTTPTIVIEGEALDNEPVTSPEHDSIHLYKTCEPR